MIDNLLKPNYHYFEYSYTFNAHGDIVSSDNRHYTERNAHEMERYTRIAIESVYDFNCKDNRNLKNDLTVAEKRALSDLCEVISKNSYSSKAALTNLMLSIQNRLITQM